MSSITKKLTDIEFARDPSGLGGGLSGKTSLEGTALSIQAQKEAAAAQAIEVEKARQQLAMLYPAAQQTARQGFQSGLDVFGQALPAQTDVFTQGNMGAQQAITQGLQQQQNALFGNQVDYSQLQPFQIQQPDLSFFQQQLPSLVDPYAPKTNEQMGVGGVLPQGNFTGPIQNNTNPFAQMVNPSGTGFKDIFAGRSLNSSNF